MKLLHAKQNQPPFSEDAIFGDCQGKTESCLTLVDTDFGDVRAAMGSAGKFSRNNPAGAVFGRTCCGSQGHRGFWVSTKVSGTDRENTRKFSAFLVEK